MATRNLWLNSHFSEAAGELQKLFSDAGFELKDKRILDIGTGDGLIAAGLSARAGCHVTGIDLLETDKDNLLSASPRKFRKVLEGNLSFKQVTGNTWDFPDAHFDGIFSWSAAEHFEDSVEIYSEARRVLSPSGIFVLQTYPLWKSRWGHHLDTWLPEFFHLDKNEAQIESALAALTESRVPVELSNRKFSRDMIEILSDKGLDRAAWVQLCMTSLRSCNKIQADEIFKALHDSGFEVRRVELMTLPTMLPEGLGNQNLLNYVVEGLKLICVPLRNE